MKRADRMARSPDPSTARQTDFKAAAFDGGRARFREGEGAKPFARPGACGSGSSMVKAKQPRRKRRQTEHAAKRTKDEEMEMTTIGDSKGEFRGIVYRNDADLKAWVANRPREAALEPDLPIID